MADDPRVRAQMGLPPLDGSPVVSPRISLLFDDPSSSHSASTEVNYLDGHISNADELGLDPSDGATPALFIPRIESGRSSLSDRVAHPSLHSSPNGQAVNSQRSRGLNLGTDDSLGASSLFPPPSSSSSSSSFIQLVGASSPGHTRSYKGLSVVPVIEAPLPSRGRGRGDRDEPAQEQPDGGKTQDETRKVENAGTGGKLEAVGSPPRTPRRSSMGEFFEDTKAKVVSNLTKFKGVAKFVVLKKQLESAEAADPKNRRVNAEQDGAGPKLGSAHGVNKIAAYKQMLEEKKLLREQEDLKHETLVDQLKLRKKTALLQDVSKMGIIQEAIKKKERSDAMLCGILPVWYPGLWYIKYWDLFIAVLVFSQMILIPFQFAEFPDGEVQAFEYIDICVDLIFFTDMIFQFNMAVQVGETGYYGDTVELVTNRWQIAKSYCSGWLAIDLAAISPLFIFVYTLSQTASDGSSGSNNTKFLKLTKAARLPRLFRLLRIFRVLRALNMKSRVMQWLLYSRFSNLFGLVTWIVIVLIVVHIYACIWYMISGTNVAQRFVIPTPTLFSHATYDEETDTVDVDPFYGKYYWDKATESAVFVSASYAMAMNQAVLLIMGSSLDTETDTERVACSLFNIFGAIFMAVIYGEVSMYISNFYYSSNLFKKKMTDLYESMEALKLPQSLQERIHLFYKYVWDEHHSIDGRPAILTFVPELSTNLAKEIYLYLFSDMITKVPMFHNRPADVIQHLVLAVQTLIYMPKDYVIVKGEFGAEMFFIQSGKCDVIIEMKEAVVPQNKEHNRDGANRRPNTNWNTVPTQIPVTNQSSSPGLVKIGGEKSNAHRIVEKVVKELENGNFFGEIALITDSRRTASIRARTFTELLVLSRDDFDRIMINNPQDKEEMKSMIRAKYNDSAASNALVQKPVQEKRGVPDLNASAPLPPIDERKAEDAQTRDAALMAARPSYVRRRSLVTEYKQGKLADVGVAGGGDPHATMAMAGEMSEIKSQLRNLQTLILSVSGNVLNLKNEQEKQKKKARRKREKLKAMTQKLQRDAESGDAAADSARDSAFDDPPPVSVRSSAEYWTSSSSEEDEDDGKFC